VRSAWRALYAAEGSDWFWWYSHRNSSQQDALYDLLFRNDLAAVYEALGDPVPAWLAQPIHKAAEPTPVDRRPAQGYVTPVLTGAAYAGEAWAAAAQFRPASASSGTMQRAGSPIERLFVGHDARNLYLRLELGAALDAYDVGIYLAGNPTAATGQRVRAQYRFPNEPPAQLAVQWEVRREPGQPAPFLYQADGREGWVAVGPVAASLGERVLEASIPLSLLGLALNDTVRLLIVLAQDGSVAAQLPEGAMGTVELREF
jgi:hypothetical protein